MLKTIIKLTALLFFVVLLYSGLSIPAIADLTTPNKTTLDLQQKNVSDWAIEEVKLAQQAGLITEHTGENYTVKITRFQFAELITNMVELVTGKEIAPAAVDSFIDCTEISVLKANAAGIVLGVGNNVFDPDSTTNREQIATMVARAIEFIEAETGKNYTPKVPDIDRFSDRRDISNWAAYGVGLLAANDIMKGVSSTVAGPKMPCTIEQSILLVYRFFVKTNTPITASNSRAEEKTSPEGIEDNNEGTNASTNSATRPVNIDNANVFEISNAQGKEGETVSVLLSVGGQVKTCGFDLSIMYDENLELVSYDDNKDLDIIVNDRAVSQGIILNYSSATNLTKSCDVIELTFCIKSANKASIPLQISVTSIYMVENNDVVKADCHVKDAVILVRE